MFVEALDNVLQDMKAQDFPFDKVGSMTKKHELEQEHREAVK